MKGYQLHQERMEGIHKQNQLHTYLWSTTGLFLLDSHSLFHQRQSLDLELGES